MMLTSVPRRESCHPYEGNYVKDLLCLGRALSDTIIVDNSPHSYVFQVWLSPSCMVPPLIMHSERYRVFDSCMQPECAVPIGTFIDEKDDTELLDILPILHEMRTVDDVREVLGLRVAQLHAKQRSSAQQKARFAQRYG